MEQSSSKEVGFRPTRGSGVLEPLLAYLRARKANELIPSSVRKGRILDIGCGSFPYFLSHTFFAEKFAIERETPKTPSPDISWHSVDLNKDAHLPFEDGFFGAVTMLAVVEHLDPNVMVALLRESHRVLEPGGVLVITTPTPWANELLHWMARLNLVSAEEIEEHVFAYTLPLLGWYFGAAGFQIDHVRFGYFELMCNMWAVARR